MEQDKIITLKRIWYNILYTVNRVVFPPAKVMYVFWTFCWLLSMTTNNIAEWGPYVPALIIGHVVYCGIANLIFLMCRKKCIQYKIKISEKHLKRIKGLMRELDPVEYARKYPYDNQGRAQNSLAGYYNYDYMSGIDFEQFCANLLINLGFQNVNTTKASGDHGIDILAEKDDVTYAIQCKCYSSNIGNAAVQQALTGKKFYHRDIAVVLTNQYFTAQAKEEASALGVKLWDRDKLNEMISLVEQR